MGEKTIRVINYFDGDFGKRGGGIESFLTNVSQGMDEQGIEFIILLDHGTTNIYEAQLKRNHVAVIVLPDHSSSFFPRMWGLARYLHKHLAKEDIFVVQGSGPDHYKLAFIARMCGGRHVLFHLHSAPSTQPVHWLRNWERHFCRVFFQYAPTMRAACSSAAGDALFGQLPYTVVHNGICVERFRFNEKKRHTLRKQWGVENSFVIGQVARLAYPKNQQFTIDFACMLRFQGVSCHVVLVGDGPDKEQLYTHACEKGMEQYLTILSPTDQVHDMYSAFDVFMFPSYFEGLGIVALEAQAAGLPILCSENVPKDVFLTSMIQQAPLSHIEQWVEHAQNMIANPPDRDSESRLGMRAVAKAGFTNENARRELITIYQQMINDKKCKTF